MAGSRLLDLSIVVAGLATIACAGSEIVVGDLVALLPESEAFVETARIDVGTPEGRRHLVAGFLPADELWANRPDESFVWTVGGQATFRFFVFEARDLSLTLTGRPDPGADPSAADFRVVANGTPLTRVEVEPGWGTYRVTVPRQLIVAGENHLTLDFAAGPAVGELVGRRLAVDGIDFRRTVISYPPRRELGSTGPALILPYLSGVWYDLAVPEGARLQIDAIRAYGPHGEDPEGLIEVVLGQPPDTIRHTVPAGESLSLPLPPGPLRLGLLSIPAGDPNSRVERRQNEEAVGLVLGRPRVLAPED